MSNRNAWIVGSSTVAVLLGVLAFGASQAWSGTEKSADKQAASKESQRDPVAVTVAPVTVRPIQRSVKIVGSFFGFDEVVVTPEVAGIAVKIYHDVGDVVKPGEPLMELEKTPYQLAADEAKREMESDLAKIGLTEMPKGEVDFRSLPTLIRAENVRANAQSRMKRAEQLRAEKAIAEEALESAVTEYKVAEANCRQALLDAQSTLATARFKQAKYNVAMDKLGDTTVKVPQPTLLTSRAVGDVPLEYVVASRKVAEGEMVMVTPFMSNGAFRLVMDRVLKYRGAVPERYVGEVKEGQAVSLKVDAFPGKLFQGKLARVNPTVDRTNRTFEIEATVSNESRTLKAGGFAEGDVLTRVDSEAITVPTEAVITFVGSSRVYVVQDDKSHAIPVEPGESGQGWIEIVGRFPRNAQVITSGHAQLAEGVPVKVRGGEKVAAK